MNALFFPGLCAPHIYIYIFPNASARHELDFGCPHLGVCCVDDVKYIIYLYMRTTYNTLRLERDVCCGRRKRAHTTQNVWWRTRILVLRVSDIYLDGDAKAALILDVFYGAIWR